MNEKKDIVMDDFERAIEDMNDVGKAPDETELVSEPLKNSYRDELEARGFKPDVGERWPDTEDVKEADRQQRSRRILVRGGRRLGKILGPDAAPLVKASTPPKQEARPLRVGDLVRALGYVYRVRKLTNKDVVLRPARPEDIK